MAAKHLLYYIFILSVIFIVDSQVCYETKDFIKTETKYGPGIVTYSSYCENVYSEQICIKSKWSYKYFTKQIRVTKLVKTCCKGYQEVARHSSSNNIICEPILNMTRDLTEINTERSTEANVNGIYNTDKPVSRELSVDNAAVKRNKNYNSVDNEPLKMTQAITDSELLDRTTRRIPQEYITERVSKVDVTDIPPDPELTVTTIVPSIAQSSADLNSTNTTEASARTWIEEYGLSMILPLAVLIIIIIVAVVAWRWTFVRLFLAGKYKVNGSKTSKQHACSKTDRQIASTIEMDNRNLSY